MKTGKVSYNYILVANRYYNPRISQFYATDPLAEKYPGMSPYTYPIGWAVTFGATIYLTSRLGYDLYMEINEYNEKPK